MKDTKLPFKEYTVMSNNLIQNLNCSDVYRTYTLLLTADKDSLETAMNDKTTDIVRLTENITLRNDLDTIFSIEKSKTLDLNGHTITVPDGRIIKF